MKSLFLFFFFSDESFVMAEELLYLQIFDVSTVCLISMFMDFLSFWVIPVLAVLAISQTQNDRTCHRESKVVVK